MLFPLSWIKEHVDVKLPFPELAEKLSAAGLTIEVWKKDADDIIFDPEITPNRPDWMSVTGIAREIAAVTDAKLKSSIITPKFPAKINNPLAITIKPNYDIVPRITSVIVRNVRVKSSPEWLQKRIKQIGLRPINNLVDITNYVLWLYGNALHVFDYDKIRGKQMLVELSKEGESFRSLDGMNYTLPKNAIIIKDLGRVIDLIPLKGGENTAVSNETSTILLHSIICDPALIRRVSQTLNLRSDSSAIAERGMDPNGTIRAVNHALKLILDLAGGEIASEILDHKKEEFKSWVVDLSHKRITDVLGINVESQKVTTIFESLGLKTTSRPKPSLSYSIEIPTFRSDLHLEEDLIEEVGRIIGYNSFPKSLPHSAPPLTQVSYARNYDLSYDVKQFLCAGGYNEIYTYSLISETHLNSLEVNPVEAIRIDNPISREYEYLRPYLIGNLLEALKLNQANFPNVQFFELGKVYKGPTIDKAEESYHLTGIETGYKYFEAKGLLESLLDRWAVDYQITPPSKSDPTNWMHPGRNAVIRSGDGSYLGFLGELHPALLDKFSVKSRATAWSLKYNLFEQLSSSARVYQPPPKYPSVIEDLSLIVPSKVLYGEIEKSIKSVSPLVDSINLIDTLEGSYTVRITYLDKNKNLTLPDITPIRNKILAGLKEKLQVKLKV